MAAAGAARVTLQRIVEANLADTDQYIQPSTWVVCIHFWPEKFLEGRIGVVISALQHQTDASVKFAGSNN